MAFNNDQSDTVNVSSCDRIEFDLLQDIHYIFNEPLSSFTDLALDNSSKRFSSQDQNASPNKMDLYSSSYYQINNNFDANIFNEVKVTGETEANAVDTNNKKYTSSQSCHADRSECEQQLMSSGLEIEVKKKRGRPKRDASAGWPKRPLSAYNIFFQQERKRLITIMPNEGKDKNKKRCSLSFTDLARKIASNWKKLSNADKIPFEELARANRKLYRKKVDFILHKNQNPKKLSPSKFDRSLDDCPLSTCDDVDKMPLKKRRGRPKRNPEEGWPKRPLSAYNIFFKHERLKLLRHRSLQPMDLDFCNLSINQKGRNNFKRKKHGIISFVDLSRTIAVKWNVMTEEDKSPYKLRARHNMIMYKKELKIFLSERGNSD